MAREHIGAAALLGMAVAVAACSSTSSAPRCPSACPLATLTTRLVSGSVTWSAGTVAQHTVPLTDATAEASTSDACTVSNLVQTVSMNGAVVPYGPSIDCPAPTGNDDLTLFMKGLADPRDFTLGSSVLPAAEAELALEYAEIHPGAAVQLCDPGLQNVQLTLTVNEATGTSMPYPQLVSRPYRRSFQVDLDTGPLTDTTCGTIAVHLTAQFVQADADVVYDPNGPCTCI